VNSVLSSIVTSVAASLLLLAAAPAVRAQDAAAAASAPSPAAAASGAAAPGAAASAAAASAPTGPAFDILEYQVEGNTVLSNVAIERALEDHLGPGRHMSDVEAARAALEAAYQKAGYLTIGVDIPEQRIDDGVVRLSVLEGRVREVYVTGSRYHSQGWIRAHVGALAAGAVPDFNVVQTQLAEVNREDRRVQPVLRPGRLPGTVDIDLQVNDTLPAGGSLEVNNQNARDTTAARVLASAHYDNAFQRDHAVTATLQVAPEDPQESTVGILNYALPFDGGDTLATNLVASNSNVDSLGGTQVFGKGFTLGLRWQHPIALSNGYWSVSTGADYKDLRQKTRFGGDSIDTPLRYLPFQLGLFGLWTSGPDRVQFTGGGTFAIRQIFARTVSCPVPGGESQQDQFACSRKGADGSFGIVRGDLRYTHQFLEASVMMRAGAQFASQPLVSAEQYALGGADTVRGYYESESTGDEGALFSTEISSLNLATGPAVAQHVKTLELLAFLDAGMTYNIDPAVGERGHTTLLGLGAGTRLALRDGLEGQLDFAWPQKALPGRPSPDLRLHARLAWQF
jgi:hemolysin activation/secretion protein